MLGAIPSCLLSLHVRALVGRLGDSTHPGAPPTGPPSGKGSVDVGPRPTLALPCLPRACRDLVLSGLKCL